MLGSIDSVGCEVSTIGLCVWSGYQRISHCHRRFDGLDAFNSIFDGARSLGFTRQGKSICEDVLFEEMYLCTYISFGLLDEVPIN